MKHSQAGGDPSRVIGDDGEIDLHPQLLLDPFRPFHVGEDLIYGQADQLTVQLLKLFSLLFKGDELGGADGSEIAGMRE